MRSWGFMTVASLPLHVMFSWLGDGSDEGWLEEEGRGGGNIAAGSVDDKELYKSTDVL